MNILKNKSTKSFDYKSRYNGVSFYYNSKDKKYVFGTGQQLKNDISYVAHKVKPTDTLESLAFKYYNNPTLWWIIADFNRIQDPYIKLIDHFKMLKVPNMNSTNFIDLR